jgi:hypothetical protein
MMHSEVDDTWRSRIHGDEESTGHAKLRAVCFADPDFHDGWSRTVLDLSVVLTRIESGARRPCFRICVGTRAIQVGWMY